jgi:hypothetical protein
MPVVLPASPAIAPATPAQAQEAAAQVPASGKPERAGDATTTAGSVAKGQNDTALTSEELGIVLELQGIDTAVRAHEAAHMAAGAGLASGASFSYVQGPDGRGYAVGGEVGIDTSSESTPEATIAKMQQVRAAAQASGAIILAQAELQQIAIDKASATRATDETTAVEPNTPPARQAQEPIPALPGSETFPQAHAAANYAAAGQLRTGAAASRQGNGLNLIV